VVETEVMEMVEMVEMVDSEAMLIFWNMPEAKKEEKTVKAMEAMSDSHA
jgi:hypothetical protein